MRAGALAGLAVIGALVTGCSAVQGVLSPAASEGSAGHSPVGHSPASPGAVSPGHAGGSGAASPGGAATVPPSAAASGAASSPPASGLTDCTPWPAGSAGTNLDLNAASNGRTYCVAIGDTVRVQLPASGISAWRQLAVSGDALVPIVTPMRSDVMPAFPLRSYRAVRPGKATLYAIAACHPLQPRAAGAPAPAMVVMAHFGGTPISPSCMGAVATFRVLIVVS